MDVLRAKEREIEELILKQQHLEQQQIEQQQVDQPEWQQPSQYDFSSTTNSSPTFRHLVAPTKFDAECENRYGLSLVEKWKQNR